MEPGEGPGAPRPPSTPWARWAGEELAGVRAAGRWREPRPFDALGPTGALDGHAGAVVSFASNDYLGLTAHPAVRRAAAEALERWGTGSGSARLIVGSRPVHGQLEAELADWKGTEEAVLFPTGFSANLGVLGVVGRPGVTICSDELNHASIIDGCRLARAGVAVYRHADLDDLERRMTEAPGPVVVVTDTVFSMDGDVAPLARIGELCAARGALLVVDEAHAVLGPELSAVAGPEVLRVGTLSKTLGALGGFVAGPAQLCRLVVNRARPYVFTTAPTPADAAAALAALRVLRSDEGAALVGRLRAHVERVAPGHPSPIVPVVVGGEEAALKAAAALLDRGLLVPAIRPPTVAPGTSRLRITLSAAHTGEQVEALVGALAELGLGAGAPA
ncbi:MAG TPA: 8-amino-7-oxononanoate synthase [Acidimicrobiales bacterium]|nr:8-amino-7-oxononanoate synthase [Acidimicrobiales bacterium]